MDISDFATSIIDRVGIPIVLAQKDTVVDVSEGALRVLDISRSALVGTSIEAFFSRVEITEVGDRSDDGKGRRVIVYNGRTIECVDLPLEPKGYHVFVLTDITEQQQRETELRCRSAQFQSALESLPFDFWINDADNRTLLQNHYSKSLWGDVRGVHMEEVTEDREIKRKWRITNERAFNGEICTGEITYTIDGRQREFRNIVAPVHDGDTIIGILGLNIDITDVKSAIRERDQLLKELHHRIKNNLQVILSMIGIDRDIQESNAEEILSRIERQVYSIYLVHEQLFRNERYETVDIVAYLQDLESTIDSPLPCKFHLIVETDETSTPCSIDRAVPFGLLFQEILRCFIDDCSTNQNLTARVERAEKKIRIHLTTSESDNAPSRFDKEAYSALTIKSPFVTGLLEQIDGSLTFDGDTRSVVTLTFAPHAP